MGSIITKGWLHIISAWLELDSNWITVYVFSCSFSVKSNLTNTVLKMQLSFLKKFSINKIILISDYFLIIIYCFLSHIHGFQQPLVTVWWRLTDTVTAFPGTDPTGKCDSPYLGTFNTVERLCTTLLTGRVRAGWSLIFQAIHNVSHPFAHKVRMAFSSCLSRTVSATLSLSLSVSLSQVKAHMAYTHFQKRTTDCPASLRYKM